MGIYIIRAKGGPAKIGFTDQDPHVRIASIATAHWAKIELVAFIEGDRSTEKALHKRFSSSRIRGEWFDLSPDLLDFINSLPKPPKKPARKMSDYDEDYTSALREIWFDMSIPSNNAAAKKAGVSYQHLRAHFGPSGREDGLSGRRAMRQAAIDTARKRTDDGRCTADRLFELWGSAADIAEVVSKSGWPQATIYRHFKMAGITREMARLEMANRRKAKRPRGKT